MKYSRKFIGWKIHQIRNNELIFSKNNFIRVCDYSYSIKFTKKISVDFSTKLLFLFPVLSKILRKEIFELKKFNSGFSGFFDGYFFYISNKFLFKFSDFKGNRPLRLLHDEFNNRLLFGEYFSNGEKNELKRDEVKVFQFDANLRISNPFTFEKNDIRHIHNIILNKYNHKYIVLTGDNDNECKIIEFDYDFNSFNTLASNNQIYRAVDLVCQTDGYLVASDTEKVKNVIYSLGNDKKTSHFNDVEGSVFFIKKYLNFYLATTALEPSIINQQKHVFLYASLDGKIWVTIKKFKKSFYPLCLSKIFRYPTIELIDISEPGFKDIPLYFRNLKNYRDGSYFFKQQDIFNEIVKCLC